MTQLYQSPEAELGAATVETYQPRMFQASGRLGRARYLVYVMTLSMFMYVVMALTMAAGFGTTDPANGAGIAMILMMLVVTGVGIFMTVMGVIYGIRRLNDLNISGWLILLMFVPLANFVLAIMLFFVPGSKGANKYGAKPVANSTGVIAALVVLLVLFIGGFVGMGAMVASMGAGMQDPAMYRMDGN